MYGIEGISSIAQHVVSAQAMELPMPISDDVDPDLLISRLAGPLAPADRDAFRKAAEAALARVPCWGEGAVYRAVAVLQRDYFVPPTDTRSPWGTESSHRSKLKDAPPIEHDAPDRRFTRHPRPAR
jgi:hypothetical protein